MKMDAEEAVLTKLGLDFHVLDSGCCGMAGSFGFERGERYDVSIRCGERVLLPAVRGAPKDTLLITDGFSCREQISQTTGRRTHHLAQVIQMAMHEGENRRRGESVEEGYSHLRPQNGFNLPLSRLEKAMAAAAGGLLVAAVAWGLKRAFSGNPTSRRN
jgi:hypothetical protein